METITYNQATLAYLCQVSPNTISRVISTLKIEPAVENNHTKKYTLANARCITNEIFASQNRPVHLKTQVFYNFKGGTGKTSICYQVATHLAILGFSVLCLDLDPQSHLSSMMHIPEDYTGPTIYDVLINGLPVEDALVPIFPGLDFIPANISMTRIEVPLNAKHKREEKLTQILVPLRERYDFIILDTNPTISTLNLNALLASDRINIVCETQPFSLSGLRVLFDEVSSFFADMTKPFNCCIIPNKYEIKTATAQQVLGSLRSDYGDLVANAIIRKSEDINIAAKKKLPLSAFCKLRSTAYEDVMELIHLLIHDSCTLHMNKLVA
ncbi:MAG TPA: ParA family protein [Candidatus Nitrosotenuis sp.]|nr:ParA family protein [Candidatus Nitrosotenuis sp.]